MAFCRKITYYTLLSLIVGLIGVLLQIYRSNRSFVMNSFAVIDKLIEENDNKWAIAECKALVQSDFINKNDEAKLYLKIGTLYFHDDKYEMAESYCEKCISLSIDEFITPAKKCVALAKAKLNKFNDSVNILKSIPSIKDYEHELSYILLHDNKISEALTILTTSEETNSIKYKKLLGITYYLQGEYQLAHDIYKQLTLLNPIDADIYYNYGIILLSLNSNNLAKQNFEQSIKLNSNILKYTNNLLHDNNNNI